MSRTLLVLRHAKALANDDGGDAARALAPGGERDAERVGLWLHEEGLIPDHVVCSPARRAAETAAHVCRGVGFGADRIRQDARIYEAALDTLVSVLRDTPPEARCMLLVGHNPGLGGLIAALTGLPAALNPADMAVIGYAGDWANIGRGKGTVLQLVQPGK